MKRWIRTSVPAVAALAGLFAAARPAAAQFRLGPQLAWGDDMELAVGARIGIPIGPGAAVAGIEGILSVDYFVDCDGCTYIEATPAVALGVGLLGLGVYAGVGANVARISFDEGTSGNGASDTEVGLALLVGVRIPMGLFGEWRQTSGGAEQGVFTVGFTLGG